MVDISFLAKNLTLAEICRIDLKDNENSTLLLTKHKQNIVYGGYTFTSIPMQRGPVQYHANLEVDKMDLTIGIVGIQIGSENLSIPSCIRRDFFRNARVRMWVIDYSDPSIVGRMFWDGYVTGEIGYAKGALTLSVGSILDCLGDKFPKLIYSEFCQHSHYSTAAPGAFHTLCELNEDDWKEVDGIDDGSTTVNIIAPMFAFSNHSQGYWERGKLYWNGVRRSISYHGNGFVQLLTPLPSVPTVDDVVIASPGCNRTSTACRDRFNNMTHFFGFEYIPKPEILYASLTQ